MKIVTSNPVYPVQRCLAAVFLLALSGCVSAVSDVKDTAATVAPTAAAVPAQTPSPEQAGVAAQHPNGGYVDPALVSAASTHAPAPSSPQATGSAQGQGVPDAYGHAPQISGLTTQPTGISASSLSIYANSAPSAGAPAASSGATADGAAAGSMSAYAPSQKIVPALNSVYSAPAVIPQPAVPVVPQPVQQQSANDIPVAAPVSKQAMAAQALPVKQALPTGYGGMPTAAFLAGGAKKRGTAASAGLMQVAALPVTGAARGAAGTALSGHATMPAGFDDAHIDDDDGKPAGLMKLASLSGLSRVAPNGLLVQTDQVNVGCFKPEMIRRIKEVEAHYHRPAMVTSGYRPPKATTQGSKHYTCDAADIQVSGVSKWELATYLRSLPDRGGVGTYCHTESVHMDLGEPRDWNWRCRKMAASL